MRHLQDARDVSSWRNTGFDLYGNGVPIVVVCFLAESSSNLNVPEMEHSLSVRVSIQERLSKTEGGHWDASEIE